MDQEQTRQTLERLRRQRQEAEEKRARYKASADLAKARHDEAMVKLKELGVDSVEEAKALLDELRREVDLKVTEITNRMKALS